MKIFQRHFFETVELDLGETEFVYTLKSAGSKNKFSVDYIDFDPTVQSEMEESNPWWRNVGVAWIALGMISTGLRLAGEEGFRVSLWFYLGLACLAVYRFGRTSFTRHSIGNEGRIVLINNGKIESILRELTSRRRGRLREVFGEIDFEADPAREIARFEWLKKEGALTDTEAAEKILAVREANEDMPEKALTDVN
ncbi:MAG: hypothetical protein K0U98_27035 [Deltaproteobacteria bacterium]|nr:hypothetical protein [Deltaproteobacteria bacterium]